MAISFTATTFSAATVAIISLLTCTEGQYPPGINDLVGQACSPPFGYLRNTCGPETLIEETILPAPVYIYGPNTCRRTRMLLVNELEYTYQAYNYVVYSHSEYRYVEQCQLVCFPTYTCTNMTRIIERSHFECCPGFDLRPIRDESRHEQIYRSYYTATPTPPVGCPRATGETVLDCLNILNLTTFVDVFNQSDFSPLLTIGHIEFTVFAPTNAAFEDVLNEMGEVDLNILAGNHLLAGTMKESDIVFNGRFLTLANMTLHSTTVVYADQRSCQTNSQNNNPSSSIRYTNIGFINGARVVNANACVTPSSTVTLHVIDRVLMPGNGTIASILENNNDFSLFTEALKFARVFDFLGKEDGVSRTVFVPTDEAFSEQIPPDLFTCLMYNRLPLHDIVLYHISEGADFTPSLALRQFAYTLQLQVVYLMDNNGSGNITFRTDPPTSIIRPDIPASNGVIHVIDGLLIPPGFNYGSCTEFVPTTPPPATTPPTTMMPPVTTLPNITPDDAGTMDSATTSSFVTDLGESERDEGFIDYGLNP